jgi:hypothetical protein
MKLVVFISLFSYSILRGEHNFPRPSIGVDPVVFNEKLAYFSRDKLIVTIINSRTNNITQTLVSQKAISMFEFDNRLCVLTVDGHIQTIDDKGNLSTKKILNNGGVISAASIENGAHFALLGFQDGDQGLKIILYSKNKDQYVSRVIQDNLPKGVLTTGKGMVWFNSDKKSFKITTE